MVTKVGALTLANVLDRDPVERRSGLDRQYPEIGEVLAGRRNAVIYPAARMGRDVARELKAMGVRVVAFGDGNPALHGTEVDGMPILSPAQLALEHASDVVLVASTMYDSAIGEDLRSRGCRHVVPVGYLNLRLPAVFRSREYDGAWAAILEPTNRSRIEEAHALLADDQSRTVFVSKLAYYLGLAKRHLDGIRSESMIYFDDSVYDLVQDEVVVDGGAYVGDTLTSFLARTSAQFARYVAFEPDPASFERLSLVAEQDPSRITVVRAGLGDRTASARLLSTNGPDSRLVSAHEAGGADVPVVSLDEYFRGSAPPTLIKMDIEGAEASALEGAAGLIQGSAPVLAISAYHFPTDLWNIPLLIHRLAPGSSLFLRHYTREVDDTVCYAVPVGRREAKRSRSGGGGESA